MNVLARLRKFGHSARIVGFGLFVSVLAAGVLSNLVVDAIQRTDADLERLSERAERRGFALRQIEHVEGVTTELERAVLSWMLQPSDPHNAAEVERLTKAFEAEGQRATEIFSTDASEPWKSLRAPLRETRRAIAELRVANRAPAPAPADVRQRLEAPLDALLDTLDTVQADLRADRRVALERLHADLQRVQRLTSIGSVVFLVVLGGVWLGILRTLLRKQKEVDRSVAEVVRANEDLDAFAGRTAHEIRNALSPLRLGIEQLEASLASDATSVRILQRSRRSLDRASATIDALLVLARAGMATQGPTALGAVVSDVLDEIRPAADAANVRLTSLTEDLQVACDTQLVHVIVRNLVDNAIKYSASSEDPAVVVEAARDGAWARVCVSDSGPGIAEQDLEHVLEPFYRARNARTTGFGIGLPTVAKIATTHGGRIEFGSGEHGRGTRVQVWLPLMAG